MNIRLKGFHKVIIQYSFKENEDDVSERLGYSPSKISDASEHWDVDEILDVKLQIYLGKPRQLNHFSVLKIIIVINFEIF